MNSRIIITAAAALLIGFGASAQTEKKDNSKEEDSRLSKEVNVDRTIIPQQRKATRLNLTPSVSLPAIQSAQLDYSARTVTARVPAMFVPMNPAAYMDSIATDNSRGYLTIGYGPIVDGLVSGGVKLINTSKTNLNAWLQYDASMFHHDPESYGYVESDYGVEIDLPKMLFRRNTFAGGLNFTQGIGRRSSLAIDLGYGYDRFNNHEPYQYFDEQNVSYPWGVKTQRRHLIRFDGKAAFHSATDEFRYGFGAHYNAFAFGGADANKQYLFGFEASLRSFPEDESQFILDLSYDGIHNTNSPGYMFEYVPGHAYNQGMLSFTPTYRYKMDNFVADLGLRVDWTHHSGKAFHMAPNVKLTWLPVDKLAIWAKAGGGEVQNTMASLYSFTYMISPYQCYEFNSHVPLTIDGGVTIGPFSGTYVKLYGGWAKANDWLMPSRYDNGGMVFSPLDMKGGYMGIAAGYNYRNLVSIDASLEYAPRGDEKDTEKAITKGYYKWRDRAEEVANVTVTMKPMEQLEIKAGWELRANRDLYYLAWNGLPIPTQQGYYYSSLVPSQAAGKEGWRFNNVNTLSNVSIGGRWHFTPMISAFVNVDNLLNYKGYENLGVPGRGIHGIAGVSVKF